MLTATRSKSLDTHARLPATFTWGAIFASFSKNDDGGVFKKIHQIIEHVVG